MLLNVITFAKNSTDSINEVGGSQSFCNHVPLHEQKYFGAPPEQQFLQLRTFNQKIQIKWS